MNHLRKPMMTLAGLAALGVIAITPVSAQVVIRQVYTGGGSSTPQAFKQDAVELFNTGTTAFNLSGFSLQYASATGNFTSVFSFATGTTIAPGGFYLISTGTAGTGSGTSFTGFADANANLNFAATSGGKIALANGTAQLGALSGNLTGASNTGGTATIIDAIGYGTANGREGAGGTTDNAPAPLNLFQSLVRVGGTTTPQDTNINVTDFTRDDSTPGSAIIFRNSSGGTLAGAVVPGPAAIVPFLMGGGAIAARLRRRKK